MFSCIYHPCCCISCLFYAFTIMSCCCISRLFFLFVLIMSCCCISCLFYLFSSLFCFVLSQIHINQHTYVCILLLFIQYEYIHKIRYRYTLKDVRIRKEVFQGLEIIKISPQNRAKTYHKQSNHFLTSYYSSF